MKTLKLSCVFLMVAVSAALAQSATFRAHGLPTMFAEAMRPDYFEIGRVATVPYTDDTDKMLEIGKLLDRRGRDPLELKTKLGIDGKLHPRAETIVFALASENMLHLKVQCLEPFPERMEPQPSRWAFDGYFPDDRVEVHLDLNHDHHTFFRITTGPDGFSEQQHYRVNENHLTWDRGQNKLGGQLDYDWKAVPDETGWTLYLDIKLPKPDIESEKSARPWRVIGLNVVRERSVDGEEITMWCPDFNRVAAPLYFGDLYLGDSPFTVKGAQLGTVCWGENKAWLDIAGKDVSGQLEIATFNTAGQYLESSIKLSAGRTDFSFNLDPHDIMYSSLRLAVDGTYWGRYEFGWKRSILLTHRSTGGMAAAKPVPGVEGYHWKYYRYILDHLPPLHRSQDGWALLSDDGTKIDLRGADGGLDRIASLVMERFSSDEDRLAAATLLLCQQEVMVSSGTGARISRPLGPAGIIRNGAAFCGGYGELLAGLVNRIKNSRGEYFHAAVVNYIDGPVNTYGWPHHWLAGVSYGDGVALIDSELGTVFIDPATGKLLTVQELIKRPELADLTSVGLSQYFRNRRIEDFHVREYGDLWEWR